MFCICGDCTASRLDESAAGMRHWSEFGQQQIAGRAASLLNNRALMRVNISCWNLCRGVGTTAVKPR